MKRVMVMTAGVYFLFVCLVPPAHALRVVVAKIISGKIFVFGIKADRRADMFWEGDLVGTASRRGFFKFKTTNLPLDCVGELSDGVDTIEVAVSGCEVSGLLATGQIVAFPASKNDAIDGFVAVDDDGTLQLGSPLSYSVSGDGLTIRDNNTGLMWEVKEAGSSCLHCVSDTNRWSGGGTQETIWDWLDDVNAEGGTGYAGYDDWRIPNLRELLSIVDYGQDGSARRLIDPAFDPAGNGHWTSTSPLPTGDDPAMRVNFQPGVVVTRSDRGGPGFIRAVRGP